MHNFYLCKCYIKIVIKHTTEYVKFYYFFLFPTFICAKNYFLLKFAKFFLDKQKKRFTFRQ